MISFDSADLIIRDLLRLKPIETETIELSGCLNRILAEDVFSDTDMPPFDNSAVDGFAVKFNKDISSWPVTGEVSAGNFSGNVSAGADSALRIMTGAIIPSGFDCVIPLEDVTASGNNISLLPGVNYKPAMNIRRKGSDLALGSIALPAFTNIKAKHFGLLASCGKNMVKVCRKLKIGVLATGDELIEIDDFPTGDKIRSSNNISLMAALLELNMTPVSFGIARDNREEIKLKVSQALNSGIDILLTTGGVSVGKYDFMKEVFRDLGVNILFDRVNIRPGKPFVCGTFDNSRVLVFGLPGNPVSSFVTYKVLIEENILRYFRQEGLKIVSAELKTPVSKKDGKRHFMRGNLGLSTSGSRTVSKPESQSSGNLVQMAQSDCLVIIPEECSKIRQGEKVQCILI